MTIKSMIYALDPFFFISIFVLLILGILLLLHSHKNSLSSAL